MDTPDREQVPGLEVSVETVEISDGRNLYLYTFIEAGQEPGKEDPSQVS